MIQLDMISEHSLASTCNEYHIFSISNWYFTKCMFKCIEIETWKIEIDKDVFTIVRTEATGVKIHDCQVSLVAVITFWVFFKL